MPAKSARIDSVVKRLELPPRHLRKSAASCCRDDRRRISGGSALGLLVGNVCGRRQRRYAALSRDRSAGVILAADLRPMGRRSCTAAWQRIRKIFGRQGMVIALPGLGRTELRFFSKDEMALLLSSHCRTWWQ